VPGARGGLPHSYARDPAFGGPLPKRPCTERVDAPRPARRPTEAYPRRYGEGGKRSRRRCSGPRMPGSSGNGPPEAGARSLPVPLNAIPSSLHRPLRGTPRCAPWHGDCVRRPHAPGSVFAFRRGRAAAPPSPEPSGETVPWRNAVLPRPPRGCRTRPHTRPGPPPPVPGR
jgi:hypothetical protein